MTNKETERYEIGYLAKTTLTDEELIDVAGKLRNNILEKGGLIISEGENKRQNLAFSIKGETSAFFNWIKFSLQPEKIREIKNAAEQDKNILRFLISKAEKEGKIKPARALRVQKTKPVAHPPKETEEQKPQIIEEEIDKKLEELLGE